MSRTRLFIKATPAILVMIVALVGTQLFSQAITYTWDGGGSSTDWTDADNWDKNSGYPGTNDIAIFNSSTVTVVPTVPTTGITIAALNITVDQTIHLAGGLSVTTMNIAADKALMLTKGTRGVMTINGLATLGSGARLLGGGTLTPISVTIGTTGQISMPDCATTKTTYFGSNIRTVISNPTFMQSAVRLDGPVDISSVAVKLGNYNLYLGVNATLTGANAPSNKSNQAGCFYTVNGDFITNPAQGRVCKEYTATGQSFLFPIATVVGPGGNDTEGITTIEIGIGSTCTTGSFDVLNSYPFPHISVRAVYNHNAQHPDANASSTLWYYWSVKGHGTPATTGLVGRVAFHAKYRSQDPNIYSAIYSPNVEDMNPSLLLGSWYLTGSTNGYKQSDTWYVEFGPYSSTSTVACMPGFGDISVGQGGGGVPVELTSFSARYLDGSVRLNWQTATEINNHGFYVERSLDGENWEDISFVSGAGTSNVPLSYSYTDLLNNIPKRVPQIAYRLRQEDRDGTTDYSGIVYASTGAQPEGVELYRAYPNPFNPSTTLSFSLQESAHVTLKVYNTFGQQVATAADADFDAGFHTVEFEGSALPSGVYVAVFEAAGSVQQQKLVLNK